jgi:His-Xaa-Ser system protein HxsD
MSEDTADFTFTLGEREVSFDIDEEVYALDAVYGASYLFVDRCYVFLARPAERKVRVRLRAKGEAGADELEALAGEFANELLNSQLRVRLGRETAAIREQYMARAFFAPRQNATIAELLAELDAEELEEEPLEIPVPWQDAAPAAAPPQAAPPQAEERPEDG